MADQYLLTPYFVNERVSGLEPLGQTGWLLNTAGPAALPGKAARPFRSNLA